MSDSADSEESPEANRELAEEMYARFQAGESKSSLEIEFWDDGTSHGKRFGESSDRTRAPMPPRF